MGNRVADGVGDVDRARPCLDGALDGTTEEIMLGPRAVLTGPLDIAAEIARVADAVDDGLVHRRRLHLQLVLHVQRGGCDEGVNTRARSVLERLPGPIDVPSR